jgi:hypothetical protein
MPEDRTPHKISLTEPMDPDEDLRSRSPRKHEAKEANKSLPRQSNQRTSAAGRADPSGGYDVGQRKLI